MGSGRTTTLYSALAALTGRGFSIGNVNALSWLTIILSLVLTAFVWAVGLISRGVIIL